MAHRRCGTWNGQTRTNVKSPLVQWTVKLSVHLPPLDSFGFSQLFAEQIATKFVKHDSLVDSCDRIAVLRPTRRTLFWKILNRLDQHMVTYRTFELLTSRITGKSIPQEARAATTSHNLVRCIRKVRYKYLGYILRSDPDRLTYRAVTQKYLMNEGGSILMDAPPHTSLQHLTHLAMDKATWNAGTAAILWGY